MKTNPKAVDTRRDTSVRTAGGHGVYAAKQDPEALLRRAVMANLLWEDNFYQDGKSIAEEIINLIPKVKPSVCFDIAVEARVDQKLRHVPLLIAREMARLDIHKKLVGDLLPLIILRADEITEFMALYWKDKKQPISKQVRIGLSKAFEKFDAYQFAKYNRDTQIKFRDVLRLLRLSPPQGKAELYEQIYMDTLPTPDTWEVALSAGKDKKATWERLISEKKLGALAFIRNLRNMEEAKVSQPIIREGFRTINPQWLLPLNVLAAVKAAPRWEQECEELMMRGFAKGAKLPGYTVLVIDVSGSMGDGVSGKSTMTRLDAGAALALLAREVCQHVAIYATAGSDSTRKHKTELVPAHRGFGLVETMSREAGKLGGGGIFTRQCLEYIAPLEWQQDPDRIIIFSDSQDCDLDKSALPRPFAKRNYIIDVSAHTRGIAYDRVWTAEISGWSEHFLSYIAALEGIGLAEDTDN